MRRMKKSNEYRKIKNRWGWRPEVQRAAEKSYYGKSSDNMPHKKKSNNKGKPRGDHKHTYIHALITDRYNGKEFSYIGKVCSICGRLDRNNWKWEWKAQAGKEWRSSEGLPRYIKTDEDRAEPFNE